MYLYKKRSPTVVRIVERRVGFVNANINKFRQKPAYTYLIIFTVLPSDSFTMAIPFELAVALLPSMP